MIGRMFRDHPSALGMSWSGHAVGAFVIGVRMIGAGVACIVHAIVPALFAQAAGRTVTDLYTHMARRKANAASPDAWPDYEI